MSKTTYVEIPVGLEESFAKSLCSGDRFSYARLRRNDTLLSRQRRVKIAARSLLPQISALWQALSSVEKAAWTAAGATCGMKGWQCFVHDCSIRLGQSLSVPGDASDKHQGWVGELYVADPATEIKIAQFHPHQYFTYHKVAGTKNQYAPVSVEEGFGLPLTIGLSYSSDLAACGADPWAKFYADIWYSYQGENLIFSLEIPLDLVSDWKTVTASKTLLESIVIGYTLRFHLHDLRGSLWFDNIIASHNAVNWARDPRCNNIAQTFTKQWAQIPKHWAAEVLPVGAEYDSVYKDF